MNADAVLPYILVALLALLVLDWRQTLAIARNPAKWYERNPGLGKHPSVGRTNTWFLGAVLFALGAAWALQGYPAIFCVGAGTACVAELVCLVDNWSIGIRV